MSRQFSGAVIVLDEGTLDALPNGAWTAAVVFRRDGTTTDGTQFLVVLDGGVNTSPILLVTISTAPEMQLTMGGIARTFGLNITNGTWYLFVVKKAAGNNKTPRANLYDFSISTWAGWVDGDGTLDANATTIVEARLGNGPGAFPLNGGEACAGLWSSALADTTVTDAGNGLHIGAQKWLDLSPAALWRLNQASTATPVTDDTGNGADQTSITGTSVSADEPAGWSYTLGGGGSTVSGVATAALGGLTAAAAGDRTVHGTAAASLGSLTATAAGDRTVNASATASLGALVGTASGQRTTYATATASLGGLTATASGQGASAAVTGTGLALLGALTATAVGRRTAHGIVAADLGALAATAAGLRTVHGQAVAPLGALTAAVVVVTAAVKADSTATLTAGHSSIPSVSAARTSVATITARRTSTPEVSSG